MDFTFFIFMLFMVDDLFMIRVKDWLHVVGCCPLFHPHCDALLSIPGHPGPGLMCHIFSLLDHGDAFSYYHDLL